MINGLSEEMDSYVADNGAIKVGLAGFGHMGSTLFAQLCRMNGFFPAAVATSRPYETKLEILGNFNIGVDGIVDVTDSESAANEISKGRTVITTNFLKLPEIINLDVIVDATGNPEVGAILGWASLDMGKHLATFNIEADSVFGSLLSAKAKNRGVVYTGLSGDEPAAVIDLFNFASFLNLQIIAVGKGKNNTLIPSCTPAMLGSNRGHRKTSAKSMCSFVDGTNTMIEMAAVANAIGFRPDIRGMHGPQCNPDDLASIFVPKADGGILVHEQIVDYTLGSLAPGVFAIVKADHPVVDDIFTYVHQIKGPYLALVRPYHLISLEAPISIAEAVLRGHSTISSKTTQRTAEVIAVAKRNLSRGEIIDGIGGYTVRGLIEDYDDSVAQDLVPIGVLENAVVLTNINEGQAIRRKDVELSATSVACILWERQRSWLRSKISSNPINDDILYGPIDDAIIKDWCESRQAQNID